MVKPFRSQKYRSFVASLPCIICGRRAVCAHFGTHGTSQKAPDTSTVPLCDPHHRELDGPGGRRAFESRYNVSLAEIAARISRKPQLRIENGYFIAQIESEHILLCQLSELPTPRNLSLPVRLVLNFRKEQLRGEPYVLARKPIRKAVSNRKEGVA